MSIEPASTPLAPTLSSSEKRNALAPKTELLLACTAIHDPSAAANLVPSFAENESSTTTLTVAGIPPSIEFHRPPRPRRVNENRVKNAFKVAAATGGEVLIRGPEVCALLSISLATLYRLMDAGEFPRPMAPTRGTRAWPMSVVQTWIRQRIVETTNDVE
jgi:prophage regulatory protein